MDRIIKHVHFQITRNCNLRCPFCGQWGKKGFFADGSGEGMTLDRWKNIINQLIEYRQKSGTNICVTVWGGEPLVSPHFDEILTLLKGEHFQTEVITNGVLIDRHMEVIASNTDKLYVSIDGPKEIHDSIRGNGVFDKVKNNLLSLKHNHVIVMSVITPVLLEQLPQFLDELNTFGIKELYLQDMIGLTSEEIMHYKKWMKDKFKIDAVNIDSWENNDRIDYSNEIDNVLYCTDFYDFTAGNVHRDSLESIFIDENSDTYREEITKGNCPTCKHCSWRITEF